MQTSALLGLRAVSPIHAGSDDARGVVDLPIQREKHNNWPVVFASSVKGALREHCGKRNDAGKEADLKAIFGAADPDGKDSMQAGALLVSDMQLLALPVACLDSAFRWVTCPTALERLQRSYRRFNIPLTGNTDWPTVPKFEDTDKAKAIVFALSAESEKKIFLREYVFEGKLCTEAQDWIAIFQKLFGTLVEEEELAERLLIISDQHFGFLAESATSVAPHIKLNENKTTEDGAMFFEETLPPETLMFLPLACEAERKRESVHNARALLDKALGAFPGGTGFFRVGGNETTGMGWFEVHINKGQP